MEYGEDDQSWSDKSNLITDFVDEFLDVTDGLENASPDDLDRAIAGAKARVIARRPYMPLPGYAVPRRYWVRQRLLQIWPAAGRHIGYPQAPYAFFAQPQPVCRTEHTRLDDVAATISLSREAWKEVNRGQS